MGNAFLIGVAVAVAMLASLGLARRTELPAPVFLVLAGLGVSFVPQVPDVILRPDVVFFVFLPPLLYSAAFFTTPRDLRRNWLPISLLAVGLVLATLFAVAGAVAAGPVALGWGAAFGLGAIVSPTDPVAAGGVLSRLGAPERLRTILEGESLVNDGVALVVYALAVAAATGGGFSVTHGVFRFFEMAAGGIALGIALGYVVAKVRRHVDDIEQEIVISLVTPYVAYVGAERAHLSGVLATVATGVFLGWRSEGLFRPRTRLQANAFWEILTFLLESVLFVLLGAQLPVVLRGLGDYPPWQLAGWSLLVFAVVAGVRLAAHLAAPVSSWRQRLVLGWSGMRGAITLAAALALPLDFPRRDLVLFLAFTLVLGTLVAQGVSLPYLVRGLGLSTRAEATRRELDARMRMTEAALARVEELAAGGEAGAATLGPLRQQYEGRLERLCSRADGDRDRQLTGQYSHAVREAIAAQRSALRQLQQERRLDQDATRRLQRELDLEESRLGGR
jgi:CPA1 family monovalent cation:H+ antiporter